MLNDQDRIFTNIYGMGDRSLAGAKKRGCWDGTAAIIQRGRDKIVEQMKVDEVAHAETALRLGGAELPGPVKAAMKASSKLMTGVAYWV